MKADELRKLAEEESGVLSVVEKNDAYYEMAREKVANDYLNDVGSISKYINDNLREIVKTNDVKGK